MNRITLIGRLTKDVEVNYTPSQIAVAAFTIAIDRGKDKDGNDKGADFPRVKVFGKQAENCERYLAKGKLVAIEGHIQTGSYKDKDDKTVYTTDIIADRVEFIDWGEKAKNGGITEDKPKVEEEYNQQGFSEIDEDIPF